MISKQYIRLYPREPPHTTSCPRLVRVMSVHDRKEGRVHTRREVLLHFPEKCVCLLVLIHLRTARGRVERQLGRRRIAALPSRLSVSMLVRLRLARNLLTIALIALCQL